MKKIIVLFSAMFLYVAGCKTPNSYIVEGVLPDDSYDNEMVYMYDYETRERVDSAFVAHGKFAFAGSVDDAVLRRIMLGRLYVNFILENGKIFLTMDDSESAKGTPLNNELSRYNSEMSVFRSDWQQKLSEIRQNEDIDDSVRQRQQEEYFKQFKENIEVVNTKYFNKNKNNALGIFVLLNWSNYLDSEPDKFDSLYEQAGDIVRNFTPLQNIVKTNEGKRKTADGLLFTDFTIERGNIDGSKASLSDYVGKGKYVLVDFWASWCGPCIAEIPVLVEVYNEYKGDMFEILGVAVWEKREATVQYLEKNNSQWPQIVGANDIPTTLYGISGIPHIILFGPDGTIVARGLRGERLKRKVADVMCDCN